MNTKILVILITIVLIGGFLRFYNLGINPPSLTWDEVAWGYNAYSIGIDGRDESGRFLPLAYLESFGDFKPPLYAYLSVIPIKIFGLTEFAVRFTSAFLGTLTILLTYFLVRGIFRGTGGALDRYIPLITAGLLAISPWHILLSRAAFEANIATFFIVLGVLLFLNATRGAPSHTSSGWIFNNTLVLVTSVISFILSMYSFNTARIVAPLLVAGLFIGKREVIFRMRRALVLSVIMGMFLFLPLGLFLRTPQAQLRFYEVNIFSDAGVIQRVNQEIQNNGNAWWSRVIHNRRFAFGVEYLRHYLDNLNPLFLFVKGDGNPKFSTQDVGQMYLWEAPFFIAGVFLMFRRRRGNWWVVPYWLIIGIVPAATARETPHALRIESTLPTFQILTSIGVVSFLSFISKMRNQIAKVHIKHMIFFVCMLFFTFNFLYFYHTYFIHYPYEFSGEWQYGYKKAIFYAKSVEGAYDKIYFTEALGRPYIYVLFYTQYNPEKFRKEAMIEREVFGFVHVRNFGKYVFAKDLGQFHLKKNRNLYVDIPEKVPSNALIQNVFHRLNGEKALIAYTL